MISLIAQSMWYDMLKEWPIITGLVLAVVGLVLVFFAHGITRFVRKKHDIGSHDKLYIVLKSFGLVFLLVALVFMTLIVII